MIGLILAGGSGTRLQSVVKDKPKPMADVSGRPFIRYLTDYLFKNGFSKIYISCFYLWQQIEDEYKNEIAANKIEIITEPRKLGTGGAIFYSMAKIFNENSTINDIVVCNGDSFVDFKPMDFFAFHKNLLSSVTLISVNVENTGRYGVLNVDDNNNVVKFCEKGLVDTNNIKVEPINAGIYAINRDLAKSYAKYYNYFVNFFNSVNNITSKPSIRADEYLGEEFSFETEVLMPLAASKLLKTFNLKKSKFIDIGIPEDYLKAEEFLKSQQL